MSVRLNKKTRPEPRLSNGSVKVDLKFYDHKYNGLPIQRVVQDEFNTIISKHEEAQESEDNPLSVELKLLTVIKTLDTDEIERKEAFKPMKTIYGGITGVRNYLKSLIIESIYKWEDSGIEIENIYINNLYLKKQRQDIKQTIKEIKMYHSNFDCCGYGLKCQNNEIPNSCVPSYILKLYNNKMKKIQEK